MTIHPSLQSVLGRKAALKIISGLTNFDRDRVAAVVKAADRGGATFVDIAADPELVRMAKQLTHLPICVSAVEPEKFLSAVAAGADLIEIGNFDAFYAAGHSLRGGRSAGANPANAIAAARDYPLRYRAAHPDVGSAGTASGGFSSRRSRYHSN